MYLNGRQFPWQQLSLDANLDLAESFYLTNVSPECRISKHWPPSQYSCAEMAAFLCAGNLALYYGEAWNASSTKMHLFDFHIHITYLQQVNTLCNKANSNTFRACNRFKSIQIGDAASSID